MTNITIEQYIKVCEREDEAFVLLAKNKADITKYANELKKIGYEEVMDSKEASKAINEKKKIYGMVNIDNCDFYYSLAKDFGAGAMQFFDFEKNKTFWIYPSKENAICLIMKGEDIININNKGYNFNNVCSSAFNQ